MRKQIVSLLLITSVIILQGTVFANTNYKFDPVMQQMPANNYNQSQYPLPQNSNVPIGYQTQNYNSYGNNYNNDTLRGNVVMVPAQTTFPAVLMTPVSSETAKAGDGVSMFLGSDFYFDKHLIAQAGSRVQGTIIKAKKGSFGNRNGQLQIKLTNIVTPSGQIIPISASIETDDGSGILKAGTAMDATKEYAKKATIGAASGAVLGVVMGALSGGKVGKGAIYGTAVGGGLGLIQPMFEKGGNVDLPQNAQFEIVLDQPITLSTNQLSY